jgi:DNA-binding MarR family transcriptional regulator
MTQEKQQINEVLDIMFRWDKAIRSVERKFNKEFDLTLNQCRMILYIQDKNYVELSHIHEWLNIDKSTTTRMIRPMIVKGLVDKFYQFGDKRKIYLKISDTGKENVAKVEAAFEKISKKFLVKIPAGKRDFTFQIMNEYLKIFNV